MDILENNRIVLDPSRVAAQVVSGIGFIGGGVIFMRRDVVRGLTTAASIWFTAALGMACGAGLPVLAVATTGIHFVVMLGFPRLVRRLPRSRRTATELHLSYEEGRELLSAILVKCSELRFTIDHVRLDREGDSLDRLEEARDLADHEGVAVERPPRRGSVALRMQVEGKRPISQLIAALSGIYGVYDVGAADEEMDLD